MKAYDSLHVFPEVPAALKLLQDKDGAIEAYIFSNGTDDMVGNSVKKSPDLGPYASLFKSLITVESLQVYKPDPKVYAHLVGAVGKKDGECEVWVVSANPFDILGAKVAGLQAAFIDRTGSGWIDRLDETQAPSIIATDVEDAVKSIIASRDDIK
jgi:2-haloacid dehalogenase